MSSFDCPIGCSVVGWSKSDFNAKCLHDILIQICSEGIPIVRDRDSWSSEPGDELHEGFDAVGAGRVGHRVALDPPAGPVKNRQQEPAALRHGEGPHYVQVDH